MYRRFVSIVLVMMLVGLAFGGKMLVRVGARSYPELRGAIDLKGTSIEIAGARAGESYDLLLDRADLARVQGSGLAVTVIHDDVETVKGEAGQDGQYQSYDEIKTVMRNWASTYPTLVMLDSIGATYEGRYIYAVKLSDNPTVDEDETEVLLEAMHHAREWATPQAARHFVDTLVTTYASNANFRNFVDNHEIWVVPVVNVDGYEYDYPDGNYWRKNRQPFSSEVGCDPNRDYNGACNGSRMSDWGSLVEGSVTCHDPGDETWFGARGAWGYEISALSQFFKQHTFVADVSLHSFSELVLWPYGNGELIPDNSFITSLGTRVAGQISALGGGTYTPEQSNHLYPTGGSSCDWMYGWAHYIGGFPCMTFVFEIGTDFYQPTSDLDAIEREVFDGLWYLYTRSDSISSTLEGAVPRPILAPLDSSSTGDFTLHWTPTRPAENHPDIWEVEELSGFSTTSEGFESGLSRWSVQGATASTTQKHAGTYSAYLGTGNNISNYIVTADPYPVQAGDSLTYWIWYNTENRFDVTVAEVSLEGKEWIQLHDRFTGNSSGWQRKAFSLAPWVGKSVFIRFRYMTDDGSTNAGVYVDDVSPTPLFSNHTTIATNVMDTLYNVTGKAPGRYWYRVRGHNLAWGWGDKGPLEDVVVTGAGIAQQTRAPVLWQALRVEPNPVQSRALVSYSVPRPGNASVEVFDAAGRLVRTLASGRCAVGVHTVAWDSRDEAGNRAQAGVYYIRLAAGTTATVRTTLVR